MIWLPVAILATMGIVIVGCLCVLHTQAKIDANTDGPPDPNRGYPITDTSLAYVGATVALSIVAAVSTGIAP